MSDVANYDADILLWSERQAALLRERKTRTHDVPNELDLENLAEEIESVAVFVSQRCASGFRPRRPPISLDILIRRS